MDESREMSLEESISTIGEIIRQSFMKADELTDVTFIIGPAKVNVPGHKTLLALRSPVFRAQFYGPLSRVNEESQGPTTVEISDMEPATFMNFLSFLYRDELTDGYKGTAEDYLDLLYSAHKYLVPGLSRLCVQELRDKIDPNNVFQVYQTALRYQEVKLKNWCLQYMNTMSSKIIKTPQFLQLERSMLSVFLESDGLAASEQEIHRAVLRWAEAKLHGDGEEKSQESIRNVLGDLIYLIRFPTMSSVEFSKEERVSVLRRKEILEIYRQIGCKDAASASQFGTNKRQLDSQIYIARRYSHANDTMEPLIVRHAAQPPYKHMRFKLRVDKRIFLRGVSLCSILRSRTFPNDSIDFQIGCTVQVGDLPSVSKVMQVNCDEVEAEKKRSRRRSFPRVFAVTLDEPSEVPANCLVAICVEVLKTRNPRMNLHAYLEPIGDLEYPLREKVQVNCAVDDRKVTFEFLGPNELGVGSNEQLPGIIFSL